MLTVVDTLKSAWVIILIMVDTRSPCVAGVEYYSKRDCKVLI